MDNGVTLYDAITNNKAVTKVYNTREKWLVPLSLVLAITLNRAVFANNIENFFSNIALFWIVYIVLMYAFNWQQIKSNKVIWFSNICTSLLVLWYFIFPLWANLEYSFVTFLVIPAVLMANAQWLKHGFTMYNTTSFGESWLLGFFVDTLSKMNYAIGAVVSFSNKDNRGVISKVLIGVLVSSIMMLILIPLLMSADQIFSYYITRFFGSLHLGSFIMHLIFVVIFFAIIYSFFWNIGVAEVMSIKIGRVYNIDKIISSTVLGSVIFVYSLFCAIQFTYLFARAGLPYGMTFAEYAREGFAQTVVICAINLIIYGVFIKHSSERTLLLRVLLSALLVLTGIMLLSGGVRLNLYIDTFGLTWLRLLSAWFIIYVSVVVVLAAFRLHMRRPIPLLVISGLFLLGWYVILGFINPDGFIYWYNSMHL